MAIDESSGVTPSERYLGKLCKKSFLTLWSYPNLFRNQGKVDGRGDGKELCDLLVICGDDVIIGFFLENADAAGKHYFDIPGENGSILLAEGHWNGVRSHVKFVAKQAADRCSYLWDAIIEEFTRHLLAGTLRQGRGQFSGSERTVQTEYALRCMAIETRFARRIYADCLIDARAKTGKGQALKRRVESMCNPATVYIFLIADWDGKDCDSYRKIREQYLEQYCFVFAQVNRQYKRIIGIATESNSRYGESHDLIYAEYDQWTPEMEKLAKEIREERGWLDPNKTMLNHRTDYEYPPVRPSIRKTHGVGIGGNKVGRNETCPCGSGRKYKKCCMRR